MRSQRLLDVAPELARDLERAGYRTPPQFGVAEIQCKTVMVPMRDGVRLATDLYLPPRLPAPAIAVRTPYGRAPDASIGVFFAFARHGYVMVSQDCRGTGDSEPDAWDYYIYEPEDSYDFVDWVTQQPWFDGFLGACGGSYVGQVQWQMAMHPRMSAIVPDVSGLGVAVDTAQKYMFSDAYSRSTGKGEEKIKIPASELEGRIIDETLAGGFFNAPLHPPFSDALLTRFPNLRSLEPFEAQSQLWERYCAMTSAQRAEFVRQATGAKNITGMDVDRLKAVFGHRISHDAQTLPHPHPNELCKSFYGAIMLRTGWYDWGLNDALETWELLRQSASESVRASCRLFIAPSAHNMPGYREGMGDHPELQHSFGATATFEMLLRWYGVVREKKIDSWPTVIYYLMGANEWRTSPDWPIPGTRATKFYFGADGKLTTQPPGAAENPDRFTYDPQNPTPTLGGSLVSYVYTPGSVDVSELQKRSDVVTYTTEPFETDFDVVGPLRCVLHASSSAVDTDFTARLCDVFPDGRAIQLQNGILRVRYRDIRGDAKLIEPGKIYRFDIDLWATANRFKAGHRLRVDIASADFPRFDRNSNRGGEPGPPIAAVQTIYHDPQHPSHLEVQVLD